MKRPIITFICAVFAIGFCEPVRAVKLFAVDASFDNGGNPTTLMVENSSFPDLINDLVKGVGDFSALSSEDTFQASIRYFGVPDALSLRYEQRASDGLYEVRLRSALTGLDETFVGVTQEDLRRKIVNWFMVDGTSETRNFIEAISKASTAAISDGRPGSTTAQMADSAFNLFGFYSRNSLNHDMRGHETGADVGIYYGSEGFEVETLAGMMQGHRTQLAIPLWLHFSKRISYVGQLKADHTVLEGTSFYGLGVDAGFAFRPVLRTDEDLFGWQLVPFVGARGVGSVDGVTAAVVYDYGLNNRLEFRLYERWLLSVVSQYSVYDNLTVSLGEYSLNTTVDQQILKNGLLLEMPVFSLKSFYGRLSFVDTRFIRDAVFTDYQSLGVGMGYYRRTFSANVDLRTDLASKYQNLSLGLEISWDL